MFCKKKNARKKYLLPSCFTTTKRLEITFVALIFLQQQKTMLEKHLFIRVLIAATDFEPGDFIFREKELVVSLKQSHH